MNSPRISRRAFLAGTAAGMAGATLAQSPEPLKRSPNETLNVAGIGVGGMGSGNIRTACQLGLNVVAVCDVNLRAARVIAKELPNVKLYQDYRVMLEKEPGIDAVIIATPDHHHAFATVAALELGKHVYCEKPLTHSVYEARRVAEAARTAGTATQMGNSGQASDSVRSTSEYIWAGAIGPVREAHVWTNRPIWPQGIERPKDVDRLPGEFDWDLWLGPAQERPFNHIYHPFRWRGWWDFGTGALGDMGCHCFHPVFKVLKLGHPTSVEATSTELFDETFPVGSIVRYQFPARDDMPPLDLIWYDGGLKPPRPEELDEGQELGDNGTLYVGDNGKMLNDRIIPESRMREYTAPAQMLPRSPGHWQEWIQACKGGEPAGADFSFAGPLTEVVLLGNVALRTGKKLLWDAPNMQIANVPEANAYLRREYRAGWSL